MYPQIYSMDLNYLRLLAGFGEVESENLQESNRETPRQ